MAATPPGFFDIRKRGFRDRAEVADVIALIDERVRPLASDIVGLAEASGRVLAQEVRSQVAVPGFDRAAMDGYALRGEDTFGASPYNPLELRIVGESLPGSPFAGKVLAGEAVRIMTGAPMPDGADAVLPFEVAQEAANVLRACEAISPRRNVGRRGEDVEPGRIVLNAGRRLRPQDLGLLASLGVAHVSTIRKPHVDILITGDELLPVGANPQDCRIVDSNSVMLGALVRRDGGASRVVGPMPDGREILRQAICESAADVLLISGGSSVGQEDHAPSLIAEIGELLVHGIALRPASPAGIGLLSAPIQSSPLASRLSSLKERPAFLLPGNPVSCLCAYDLFAGRAIRRLGGRCPELPYKREQLTLAAKVVSAVGRVDYVRVRIRAGQAEPLAVSGASLLSTTTDADGFVLVPRDSEGYPAGALVTVYRYDDACE